MERDSERLLMLGVRGAQGGLSGMGGAIVSEAAVVWQCRDGKW